MIIPRKIEKELVRFFRNDKKALLIAGARQVGKTFIIRQFGNAHYENVIEINFVENKQAKRLLENSSDQADFLFRLSALAKKPLVAGKTLIFFDGIQECKEIVTAIKFLVEEGSYRYIFSGALLGTHLKDLSSVPVGYLDIMKMYPLDFEEFALANGVAERVLSSLKTSFESRTPVDALVHEKMMALFNLYLIVGGMPAAVSKYLETNNLQEVIREHRSIINLYKMDISQYDPDRKLYIEEIYELIPSELNSQNKRFIMKNLNENFKFSRYTNSFLWLKNAGVALPTYCVKEPKSPLKLSESTNLFKLFLSDVGLLSSMCMNDIQIRVLNQEKDINFGSIYENAVAQHLVAHGFDLYYFHSKKQGEIDFVIEQGKEILPIEIKSGKDYQKHAALSNVMDNANYAIKEAYVLQNDNVSVQGKIIYYPIYMIMFLKRDGLPADLVYTLDIDVLK